MPRAIEAAGAARREFRPARIAAGGNRVLERGSPARTGLQSLGDIQGCSLNARLKETSQHVSLVSNS